MASFSDTKITPANGQKIPAVDGFTTGYMMSDELKAYILSALGQANGIASLDSTGKLVSTQLPDFANDVLAFDSIASFPATGADGVLYIAKDTNTLYRWNGSQYVSVSADTSELEQRVDTLETQVDSLETEVSILEAENAQQAKDIAYLKFANDGKTYIMEESDRDGYSVDVKPSTVTGTAFGEAVLKSMEGRDVVWNQFAPSSTTTTDWNMYDSSKISLSNDGGGIKATFREEGYGYTYGVRVRNQIPTIIGHVYICVTMIKTEAGLNFDCEIDNVGVASLEGTLAVNQWNQYTFVSTANRAFTYLLIKPKTVLAVGQSYWVKDVHLVDLTVAFGVTSVSQVTAFMRDWARAYAEAHPEYNEGEIVNNNVTEVRSEGRNLFDEQTVRGLLDTSNGNLTHFENYLCSANFIPVDPSKTYYLKSPVYDWMFFYDASKNFISENPRHDGRTFTVPSNCRYIKVMFPDYVGDYAHDICINVSDSKNGTYTPYKPPVTLTLPSICSNLHGFPTARDKVGFVNDADGKRWLERKVGVYTFTGNETYEVATYGRAFVYVDIPISYKSDRNHTHDFITDGGFTAIDDYHLEMVTMGISYWTNRFGIQLRSSSSSADRVTVEEIKNAVVGKTVLYSLDSPQLLDITSLVPEEPSLPIEDGGTLTFVNENRVATPSRISMPVKLGGTV